MKYTAVVFSCHCILLTVYVVALGMETEDCVLYEGQVSSRTFPETTMYRQLSTGVLQNGDQFAATLSLTSHTGEGCDVRILSHVVAVSCSGGKQVYKWSPHIFEAQDVTELWVHVGPFDGALGEEKRDNDNDDDDSTDLVLIGRRGFHRGHIMFPSSGLQPPITVGWKPIQAMDYYFNCVTGCLYTRNAMTSSGMHSIFFRPGHDFTKLDITYNSTEHHTFHKMSLNATDVTLNEEWKNITVVWNKKDGGIGVLIDDRPIRDLGSFSSLNEKSGIEAEVRDGGGRLRLCDQRFKEVADARINEELFNKSVSLRTTATPPQNLKVLALVCIAFLTVLSIILVVLLLKTIKDLERERAASARNDMAVDPLLGPRTATSRSTAPLCPATQGGGGGGDAITKSVPGSEPVTNASSFSFNGHNA